MQVFVCVCVCDSACVFLTVCYCFSDHGSSQKVSVTGMHCLVSLLIGLECPSCRNQHTLSEHRMEKLPRNLALENIVFRFQELQSTTISKSKSLDLSTTSPTSLDLSMPSDCDLPVFAEEGAEDCSCGMCDGEDGKEKAEWYCKQCSVLYCQGCLDRYHPKRGSLQQHRLSRPVKVERVDKEAVTYCSDHAEEVTNIYCGGCQVLVCHLCVCEGTGRHAGHKILDLDTAWKQVKVCVCVCVCMRVCVLRIVSIDKILRFTNTLIINIIIKSRNRFACDMLNTFTTHDC